MIQYLKKSRNLKRIKLYNLILNTDKMNTVMDYSLLKGTSSEVPFCFSYVSTTYCSYFCMNIPYEVKQAEKIGKVQEMA